MSIDLFFHRCIQELEAATNVVMKVFARVGHRIANKSIRSKMSYRLKLMHEKSTFEILSFSREWLRSPNPERVLNFS